jgi:hypothetical protein
MAIPRALSVIRETMPAYSSDCAPDEWRAELASTTSCRMVSQRISSQTSSAIAERGVNSAHN